MRFAGEDAALLINAQIAQGLEILNLTPETPEALAAGRDLATRWTDAAHKTLRLVALDNTLAREFTYAGPLRRDVGWDGSFAAEVRYFSAEVRARVRYLVRLQHLLIERLPA